MLTIISSIYFGAGAITTALVLRRKYLNGSDFTLNEVPHALSTIALGPVSLFIYFTANILDRGTVLIRGKKQ